MSYQVFWNAFERIAADCPASEKTALFSRTASKFYRLAT
jgi:predicted TIM-barrel fold metal-dependent hydrolase